MGCTLSKLHDFTFVLNIRYIYPYINLITVFLQELTHVIQIPDLSDGCHEFVLTNIHLVSCWYYLITRQNWNFKLFPKWNKVCGTVMMDTSNVHQLYIRQFNIIYVQSLHWIYIKWNTSNLMYIEVITVTVVSSLKLYMVQLCDLIIIFTFPF